MVSLNKEDCLEPRKCKESKEQIKLAGETKSKEVAHLNEHSVHLAGRRAA